MPSLSRMVRACHPEPTAAVTAVTTALALSVDLDPFVVAAAVLSGQLSVGWSNDWIDASRDLAVGRADKPVVQGLPVATVRTGALLALVACVPLSLRLGVRAGIAHLVGVASAWAYNLGLKSTPLSFAPFALSFGLLPNVLTLALDGHPWAPWWATGAGALLGVGAHCANVLPDLEDDRRTGVRGLPHRLGRTGTTVLAGVTLLTATVLLATGPGGSAVGWLALVAAALVFGGGLARARHPGSRAAFNAVLVVAAVDVTLLLAHGTSLR